MLTQLPRVPLLIPSSFATRAIGREVSITIFTASSLNSGEKLFFGRGNYFTFPDIHPNGWTVRKPRGTSVVGEVLQDGRLDGVFVDALGGGGVAPAGVVGPGLRGGPVPRGRGAAGLGAGTEVELLPAARGGGGVAVAVGVGAVAVWGPGAAGPPEGYRERVAAVTDSWASRFAVFDAALERWHPAGPHQYLAVLAVRPDRQGRGTGTALLRAQHEILDRSRERWPTWKPPAGGPGSCTWPMAMSITGCPSSCPADRP